MRESSILCLDPHGFHRLHYVEWGEPDNPRVLFCVHGLTRNSRDFDFLAGKLADRYRVICPDVAGRGRSEWLRDKNDYTYATYLADMVALMARVGAEELDWIGTSMGGLIGMILAGMPGTPIRRLVMNDVGSVVPKGALARIGLYLGLDPAFDSLEALEGAVRTVSPFGELTDAQWRHLATHVAKRDPDGRWRFRYDPGIAQVFKAAPPQDIDMRAQWNALQQPVLVIRGDSSDLLLAENLEEMRKRPHTQVHIVPRCGHAPALMNDTEAAVIRSFLLG